MVSTFYLWLFQAGERLSRKGYLSEHCIIIDESVSRITTEVLTPVTWVKVWIMMQSQSKKHDDLPVFYPYCNE